MMDNHTPLPGSPFYEVRVGSVVTAYKERALRVHHARFTDPPPRWFTPDLDKTHGAAHLHRFSVYWQSEFDEAARTASHPFETDVVGNAVQQIRLI